MKTIELIAQECAEDIAEIDGLCIAACPGSSDLTAKAVQPDRIAPIIAAAMREVCEPLAKTCQDASQLSVDYHKERDQLRAALNVAEGALKEMIEEKVEGPFFHEDEHGPESVLSKARQALARIAELKKPS